MRKSVAVFVGIACAALLAAAWAHRDVVSGAAEQVTVTGQVVDLACYARNKENTGMDHDRGRECAWACIKWEGHPVGLVTKDGKAYQLAGDLVADNNARIAPHLTHTVTITGEASEKDGMMMLSAKDVTMTR